MLKAKVVLRSGEIIDILYEDMDVFNGFVFFLVNSNKGSIERKIISSDLIASIHQKEVTGIE